MYWVTYTPRNGFTFTIEHDEGFSGPFINSRYRAEVLAQKHKQAHPDHLVRIVPVDLGEPEAVELADYSRDIEDGIFEAMREVEGIDTVEIAQVDGENYIKAKFTAGAHDYVIRVEKVAR